MAFYPFQWKQIQNYHIKLNQHNFSFFISSFFAAFTFGSLCCDSFFFVHFVIHCCFFAVHSIKLLINIFIEYPVKSVSNWEQASCIRKSDAFYPHTSGQWRKVMTQRGNNIKAQSDRKKWTKRKLNGN